MSLRRDVLNFECADSAQSWPRVLPRARVPGAGCRDARADTAHTTSRLTTTCAKTRATNSRYDSQFVRAMCELNVKVSIIWDGIHHGTRRGAVRRKTARDSLERVRNSGARRMVHGYA